MTSLAGVPAPAETANQGPGTTEVAVGFLFLSLATMVVTLGLALFVMGPVAYGISFAAYCAKVWAERRFKIWSPLSITLLICYAGLLLCSLVDLDLLGYTGAVIFGILATVTGFLLLIGRPFTSFYAKGKGAKRIHWTTSLVWFAAYVFSAFCSWYFIPDPLFIVLPIAASVVAVTTTLVITFWWCGPGTSRQKHRIRLDLASDMEFVEVPNRGPLFDRFCQFYAQAVEEGGRRDADAPGLQELTEMVRRQETDLGRASVKFACLHAGEIVGTLRCALDRRGQPLPSERDMSTSFDPLRKIGWLMMVGRLAVRPDFRSHPAVLTGMFGMMIDLALERDVRYVASNAFQHVTPMYLRLGFEMIFERRDPRSSVKMPHGHVCHPVMLDFGRMMMEKAERQEEEASPFKSATNPFLAERWFKRQVISSAKRFLLGRSLPRNMAEVRALLTPQPPMEAVQHAGR